MFNRRWQLAVVAVCGAVAVAAGFDDRSREPKRFGVVQAGRLYRSGELSPNELRHVARTYQLRTVISLLDPSVPESQAERATADALGLKWVNIPLRGDGSSTADERERLRAALYGEAGPTLVHCAAGANRTGLAVGLWRIERDRWDYERTLAELRAYGFDDLPKHQSMRDALAEAAAKQGR